MTNTRSYSAAEFKALENCVETLSHTLANTVVERDALHVELKAVIQQRNDSNDILRGVADERDNLRVQLTFTQKELQATARARDEYKSEFDAAQAALTNALRERDHAQESKRLADLEIARLRHVLVTENSTVATTIATEAHAQAFDDMAELRTRAKRYEMTRAALQAAYGDCASDEWKRLCLANQAAMLSLTVAREKLGV